MHFRIPLQDEQDLNNELNTIIRYHSMIIEVHELSERVTSQPMLIQCIFMTVAVGTPILRTLLVTKNAFLH